MRSRVALALLAVAIATVPLLTSCEAQVSQVSCNGAISWDEARAHLDEEWTPGSGSRISMVVTGPVVATKAGFERRPSEAGMWDESWTKAPPQLMLGQGSWQLLSGLLVVVANSDAFSDWWYLTWGEKSRAEVEADMRGDLLGKTVCVRGRVGPSGPETVEMTIDSPADIRILEIEDAAE